jgi:hypothetical protein
MPFAVELYLDAASAGAVRDLWRARADAGRPVRADRR